jgi:hypothetical protein
MKTMDEFVSHYKDCGQLEADLKYLGLKDTVLNRRLLETVVRSHTSYIVGEHRKVVLS